MGSLLGDGRSMVVQAFVFNSQRNSQRNIDARVSEPRGSSSRHGTYVGSGGAVFVGWGRCPWRERERGTLAVYRQPTGSLDQIPSTTWPRGPPPLHRRTLPRSRRGNIPNIIKPTRSFLPLPSHWPLGPLCWRPLPARQLSRLGDPILPSSESNKEPCLRRRARPSNHRLP